MGGDGISYQGWAPGGGGTQTMGGAAGDNGSLPGALGLGGSHPAGDGYHFGGGGGGYYGGGAGYGAGGGGGSSYYGVAPGASTMEGARMGNGEVVITPVAIP